jgi:uncharacterized RDD family membrane protein YckC
MFNRALAFVIDSVVLALVSLPFMDFGTKTRIEDGRAIEVHEFGLNGIEFPLWLAFTFVYFVVLEWRFAATIGKAIMGIRVVAQDGHPLSFDKVLIRNAMRLIDAFPYFIPYLVGLITMGENRGRQRLGDRAAGTMVLPKAKLVSATPES